MATGLAAIVLATFGGPLAQADAEWCVSQGVGEDFIGGDHDDLLVGTPRDDFLSGGDGNDIIDGGAGSTPASAALAAASAARPA